MSRVRKTNKVFNLFKNNFKVSLFYKPTLKTSDNNYYITLDDLIRIQMRVINGVIIIIGVEPLSGVYLAPKYEELVTSIMIQDDVTVLVSLIDNTFPIHSACVKMGAPVIEDERYLTVPKEYYDKVKETYPEVENYGFYILSVSEEKIDMDIGIETKLMKIEKLIRDIFPDCVTNKTSETNYVFKLNQTDNVRIEYIDDSIFVKDLLSSTSYTLNLIKIVDLMNTIEKFLNICENVYIINVMNTEVYRICQAKKYELIESPNQISTHHLFTQPFQGYGTFKVTNCLQH